MQDTGLFEEVKTEAFGRKRPEIGLYRLDGPELAKLPVKIGDQDSNFMDVYRRLVICELKEVPHGFCLGTDTYATGAESITVKGETGVVLFLRTLVGFKLNGVDPFRASWLYYGHDWSEDALERHEFFLFYENKAVDGTVSLGHDFPRVLKLSDSSNAIWRSHEFLDKAFQTYAYRKFYTETLIGQLMVLREDKPILFGFQRNDHTEKAAFCVSTKVYYLLWLIAALLGIIAFPQWRPYMLIAACVATANLAYVFWNLRKYARSWEP